MKKEPRIKRSRLIGMGFVLAFVLSTATIIFTGLNVRAPGSARTETTSPETPPGQVEQASDVPEQEAVEPEPAR